MDKNIVSEFRTKFEQIKREEGAYSDPLDYIELIAGFIKELMIAHGTNEIVLATPDNSNEGIEDLEESLEDWGSSLSEIESAIKNNMQIVWDRPSWIAESDLGDIDREIYFYNCSEWVYFIVVRLGIVDGELRFTWQRGRAEFQDDASDPDNLNNESVWLKPGNIPMTQFWSRLVSLLLDCEDIWKFTTMYPQLHKLPV